LRRYSDCLVTNSIQSDVTRFVTSGAITGGNWAKLLLAKLGNASEARAANLTVSIRGEEGFSGMQVTA
jgi:hypothetical protein